MGFGVEGVSRQPFRNQTELLASLLERVTNLERGQGAQGLTVSAIGSSAAVKLPFVTVMLDGGDFSDVQEAIDYFADAGKAGRVCVNPETFSPATLPIVIKKYVAVEGAAVGSLPPAYGSIPDAPPSAMSGTVFETASANNVFEFEENAYGASLENVGVKFTGGSSGHGVSADKGAGKRSLCFGKLRDIMVVGHDANHHAFNLKNAIHVEYSRLSSFGGGIFKLVNDDSTYNINFGNSVGNMIYGYVNKPLGSGVYPYHFASVGTGVMNLCSFTRMQANYCPGATVPTEHWCMYLDHIRDFSFPALDLECDSYITQFLKMVNICERNVVTDPLFYGAATGTKYMDLTNAVDCLFMGGFYGALAVSDTTGQNMFIGGATIGAMNTDSPWYRHDGIYPIVRSSQDAAIKIWKKGASDVPWHESISVDMLQVHGLYAQAFLGRFHTDHAESQYLLRSADQSGNELWAVTATGHVAKDTFMHGNVLIHNMFGCDASGNIADNVTEIGNDAYRIKRIRAVTVDSGDVCFENAMAITEAERLGFDKGLAFLSPLGKVVMVLSQNGDLCITGKVKLRLPKKVSGKR